MEREIPRALEASSSYGRREDIENSEYSPKPQFGGFFKVTNVQNKKGGPGAAVKLPHCGLKVAGSSLGNSLSACRGKAAYINPSPDPAYAGALCTGLMRHEYSMLNVLRMAPILLSRT